MAMTIKSYETAEKAFGTGECIYASRKSKYAALVGKAYHFFSRGLLTMVWSAFMVACQCVFFMALLQRKHAIY